MDTVALIRKGQQRRGLWLPVPTLYQLVIFYSTYAIQIQNDRVNSLSVKIYA